MFGRDVLKYAVGPFAAARAFLERDSVRVPEFGLMGGLLGVGELLVSGAAVGALFLGRENLGMALPVALGIYGVGKMMVGLVGAAMELGVKNID